MNVSLPTRIAKNWISALKWTVTVALVTLQSAEVLAAQATPNAVFVNTGTSSGSLSSLSQANEGKVMSLYTNRKGNLNVVFKYSSAGLSSGLSLNGRLQQRTGSNIFTLQTLNEVGVWNNVGSISGGTIYKNIMMPLPSSAIVNGSISIRLVSNPGSDDLDIDQLVIADSNDSLTALAAPTISSFLASPTTLSSGQPSILSWSTSNAASLTLNPGNVNVTGLSSISVNPVISTTYTLTAANRAGATSKSLNLSVSTEQNAGLSIPAGTKGYIQLNGTLNTNFASKVYDIDLFDTSADQIASLKQSGHIVICYFSAGTYENWRSDANQFPSSAIGSSVAGWAGENWLDIRNSVIQSIMANRMNLAVSKGCNGVDPDNVDGYTQKSGFTLSMQDQINYNRYLAQQAHHHGLLIGLKNATELVSTLVSDYDFSVVEECFAYNECSMYSPFINQNKAVLNLEYSSFSGSICTKAASLKFSTAFYSLGLDGSKYQPCP